MADLKITLLAGLQIDPGQAANLALTRKAKALIAYLALASGQPQSREKLADLLWGGSAEEQARTSLRQSLSVIRKALGDDHAGCLVAEGDRLALDPARIELDVTAFEDQASAEDPAALERAAALYRGDLLDGFSLKEEAFEAWLRAERERLRALAVQCLARLLDRYGTTPDVERRIRAATGLLALDPLHEGAHRALMRAYAAQGRQSAALKQFERCREMLRRELAVQPEPATLDLAQEIRRQRATTVAEPGGPGAIDIDLSVPDDPSIAVLPFTNMSADPDQEFFSDGITEDIITALSKIGNLLVVARNSTFTYKGQAVDVKRVSREQGVRYVLEGSVRKSGERVRVNAQLIDAATGRHAWAERYDRQLQDIFAVQDEITRQVVVALNVHLTQGEQARVWSGGTKNLDAWERARSGSEHLNRGTPEDSAEAQRLFKEALDLDPHYAEAWALLGWNYWHEADGYVQLGTEDARKTAFNIAEESAQRALDLNPACADAYALLGMCHLSKGEHDRAVAMTEKAVALAPSHAFILAISAAILNKSGRPKRSIEFVRKAMRLCPIYPPWFLYVLGTAWRMLGRHESAIGAYREQVRRSPDFLTPRVCLASLFGELGRDEEAKQSAAAVLRIDPNFSVDDYMKGLSYRDPAEAARFEDGLRKAGVPR